VQTLFYNDYVAARRRVFFHVVDASDGVTPETGETGSQPAYYTHGTGPGTNTSATLAATLAASGAYYVQLTQAELIAMGLGRHRIIHDSAASAPAVEEIEIIPHPYLHDGTLQDGGGAVVCTLAADASTTDDAYVDGFITIIGGTGAGQTRQITDYVGSSKVATVDQAWVTEPDSTSVYIIEPGSRLPSLADVWEALVDDHTTAGTFGEALRPIRRGTAQGGGSNTITLDTSASAVNDFYNGAVVRILSGAGAGQSAIISDYVGATKVATVGQTWATQPDNSSVFAIYPLGSIPGATAPTAGEVADAVWEEARADHATSGTYGEGVALATGQAAAIADALRERNIGGGADSEPSVKFALAFLAGKWTDNGDGTISVYDPSDEAEGTVLGTITYSTRERDAIGGIDSAGA
jgi:hypothetical protein